LSVYNVKRSVAGRIAAIALVLAGCHAAAPPTHYYAAGDNWAIYLAWTEDAAGHLQGQIQVIEADPNNPAKLRTLNGGFTGTRNGADISVAFPILSTYLGETWTGTLAHNTLSLVIPTAGLPGNPTLLAGSFTDFEKAAKKVQAQVDVAQQQQAQQQAIIAQQQAAAAAAAARQAELNRQIAIEYNGANDAASKVRQGYAKLNAALNNLAAALPERPQSPNSLSLQYAATFAKMQEAWAAEQAAAQVAPMTCFQKGRVQFIAGQVQFVRGQIQFLDGRAQYLLNQLDQYFGAAHDGLNAVSQWSPVVYQHAQTYAQLTGKPSPVNDPTAAIAALQKRTDASLNMYSGRVSRIVDHYKGYDQAAAALNERASAFPASISCSG
jgi:hypothetical protein